MEQKSKLEVIDEVAKAYTVNTRAVFRSGSQSACLYLTPDGKRCGVGRFLDESKINLRVINEYGGIAKVDEILADLNIDPQGCFQEPYKGHSVDFWGDIQKLHDNSINWDDQGLSEFGIVSVTGLKAKWAGL